MSFWDLLHKTYQLPIESSKSPENRSKCTKVWCKKNTGAFFDIFDISIMAAIYVEKAAKKTNLTKFEVYSKLSMIALVLGLTIKYFCKYG